jgi:hypothetical protein
MKDLAEIMMDKDERVTFRHEAKHGLDVQCLNGDIFPDIFMLG